jgi:DNA-directed RNA polymerase specialized sigma24 family protein
MLKISKRETPTQCRLILEGRMVGTCVTELSTMCALLKTELRGRTLVIDIKDVVVISQEGENVLLQLIDHGAKLRPEGLLAKGLVRQLAQRSKKQVSELIDPSHTSPREEGMRIALLHRNEISVHKDEGYTTCHDFKRLFVKEMNSLYLLAYALTGDYGTAEQCLLAGLVDCINGPLVLRHSARWWARRGIIDNAIRTIRPRATAIQEAAHVRNVKHNRREIPFYSDAAMRILHQLADFQRCVFVMSVLERYLDEDSSILLGCTVAEVRNARIEAFRQIALAHTKNGAAATAASLRRSPAV